MLPLCIRPADQCCTQWRSSSIVGIASAALTCSMSCLVSTALRGSRHIPPCEAFNAPTPARPQQRPRKRRNAEQSVANEEDGLEGLQSSATDDLGRGQHKAHRPVRATQASHIAHPPCPEAQARPPATGAGSPTAGKPTVATARSGAGGPGSVAAQACRPQGGGHNGRTAGRRKGACPAPGLK